MKKGLFRIAVCGALIAAMVLSFTACSNDGGSDGGAANVSSAAAENTSSGTGTNTIGMFDTVEEYVASDMFQAQIATLTDSLEGTGMKMEITGEGNKLIYTYTYETITNMDGLAESLEAGMDAQASTFEATASMLKAAVKVDNPVVEVVYIDANGEEIYSREFTAQ